MTVNTGQVPETKIARREAIETGVRMLIAAAVILAGYWLLPLDWFEGYGAPLVLLVVGMIGYLALVFRRMVHLAKASNPVVQLGESLILVIVGLVCLFAFTYAVLGAYEPDAFNVEVDKHAALYFSMTVTTTTGFGDIVATSPFSRNMVSLQMFITLIVLASAIRGVTFAAQLARKRTQ